MNPLLIVAALEAVLDLAMEAGLNIARFNAMREENGGGALTEEQREELLGDAQDAINRLPE